MMTNTWRIAGRLDAREASGLDAEARGAYWTSNAPTPRSVAPATTALRPNLRLGIFKIPLVISGPIGPRRRPPHPAARVKVPGKGGLCPAEPTAPPCQAECRRDL